MFWGIDREEWLVLWSGVLGAVISASVAATIAVLVLTRSNKHQRAEAALARERAATADIVAAATAFNTAIGKGADRLGGIHLEFTAAAFRWQMEAKGLDFTFTLLIWSTLFGEVVRKANTASAGSETRKAWLALLAEAASIFILFCSDWHRLAAKERVKRVRALDKSRVELEARVAALAGVDAPALSADSS